MLQGQRIEAVLEFKNNNPYFLRSNKSVPSLNTGDSFTACKVEEFKKDYISWHERFRSSFNWCFVTFSFLAK